MVLRNKRHSPRHNFDNFFVKNQIEPIQILKFLTLYNCHLVPAFNVHRWYHFFEICIDTSLTLKVLQIF
jgi:hypothetical protein